MTQADRKKRSTRMSKMVTPPAVTRMKAVLQKEMVREFLAEFLSTFVMMVFGLGAIAHMVLGDKMGSYLGVNLGFGFGVTMGVHMAGNISGAHMNAALTFTNCALGRMSWKKFPVYVLGQFLGSFLAAATIYCLFYSVSDRDASAVSLSHHGQGEQPSTARDTGLGDRHPCCHHWSVHGHELRICHQPLPGPASTLLHLIAGWGTQVFSAKDCGGCQWWPTPGCLLRCHHLLDLHWLQHPTGAPDTGELPRRMKTAEPPVLPKTMSHPTHDLFPHPVSVSPTTDLQVLSHP
ncbi:aquaporin-7 isoform X2 [Balaenoptera musculus]|uniref:Aquaporin-7 isoform X2 n=1 Tax=Balaenoptera musculus TaxID=9771 RepID=A0A8B8XSS2_BALMU|nr:aquaporin-7 isoform X2 [Balaenoptera musculus]